jgi:hypothetical protein
MTAAFLLPQPYESRPQGPREMSAALHNGDVASGLWVIALAGMAFRVLNVLARFVSLTLAPPVCLSRGPSSGRLRLKCSPGWSRRTAPQTSRDRRRAR